MKPYLTRIPLTLMLLSLALSAHAHRMWIVPAATILSSEDPWVTFDAAVSNDIFHTDYVPMRADWLSAMGPDGKEAPLQNLHTGKYRTTFDLNLTKRGTYKVYTASNGLTARWQTEDGERRFWPPRGQQPTPEGFAREVPREAEDLQVRQSSRRLETFVTAGVPSDEVFEPTKEGLEMVPVTHPNDLFAGETARFKFLIDGEPARGAAVTVLAGGMRYRNSQDAMTTETDAEGVAEITWPEAGMYWLEAAYEDENAPAPAQSRAGTYIATLEVLPL